MIERILSGQSTSQRFNWPLTGLNLPTGQNLCIRARGYYGSGFYNGSESIAESVRNAFLTPVVATPPPLNIRLSAKTNVVLSWVSAKIRPAPKPRARRAASRVWPLVATLTTK